MKVIKWIGLTVAILIGCALLIVTGALALHYRPGSVIGKRIDPGPMQLLDGSSARLADYADRVVLVAFATNG